MLNKKKVAIIYGGKSAEHEVSIQSAKNIIEAIDKEKYEPVLIAIDKKGIWHLMKSQELLQNASYPTLSANNLHNGQLSITPGTEEKQISSSVQSIPTAHIDVAFPVLHGPYGEDGSVQGLLKLANIPFVGASVMGSAVGMDKDVMKRILRDARIPIADFISFNKSQISKIYFDRIKEKLGIPLFVKPANLGSSVGVSKVTNENEFKEAIKKAFQFDRKIIVEECIPGREIECAVLGNDSPVASIPGEIKSIKQCHSFYSYEAKYTDESGAVLEIPALLDDETIEKIKLTAIKAFKVLCCEGMARVDFFLNTSNELVVNEINTIPGFTKNSMYPKLWEASGITYTDLISELIELAIQRHEEEKKLKNSY
jgi:D-alanine-D-alanine ligase